MKKISSLQNLHEMERLRTELYQVVNGKWEMLNSDEVCELSDRLDRLIVKQMHQVKNKHTCHVRF